MTNDAYRTPTQQDRTIPASAPTTARRGSGMATAALVLGILALVTCWTVIGGLILGVLAVIFGTVAARRAGRGEADGRGRAIAGVVTGVLGVVLAVGLIVFGVSLLNSPKVKNLESCLKSAGNNQAAVQQCQTQYKNSN
ncbi:protein of unknown function [Frankineae bacterium MT45]|nr:protein of unknown function [Frankineae bacterium MT45]